MSNELSYEPLNDGEDWDSILYGVDTPDKDAEPDPGMVATVVEVAPLEILFEYSKRLVPGILIDDRGLQLPENIAFSDAENLNELLTSMNASLPLLLGDLLNQAERKFREEFTQLLSDDIGRSEGTIRNWRWIANSIPWDIRPNPKHFGISKLYHVAGLRDVSLMQYIIDQGAAERTKTELVREVTDLLKMYEDAGEEAQWSVTAQRHALSISELTERVREDLTIRGYFETKDDGDEDDEPATEPAKASKTANETAADLVAKLLELAAETGQDLPKNRIALFASMVNIAKALAFDDDADHVQAAFAGMGMIAEHTLRLRLAQIEAGTEDVGCICEVGDMFDIVQFVDCPIHGDPDSEDAENEFNGNDSDIV